MSQPPPNSSDVADPGSSSEPPDGLESRARAAFEALLNLDDAHRDAVIDRDYAADAALAVRVRALLAAHRAAAAHAFLASPTFDPDAGRANGGATPAPHVGAVDVPRHVGPYKLLQRIGEGGFGAVYMAEQEHPIRRRVAVKLIKLGMDTRQVIARFEAERQALAMMDHRGIARVFDAGATDAARRIDSGQYGATPDLEATIYATVAETYHALALLPESQRHVEAAIAHYRTIADTDPEAAGMLASFLGNLALIKQGRGDTDGARRAYEEALDRRRTRYGADSSDVARIINNLGSCCSCQETLNRRACASNRRWRSTARRCRPTIRWCSTASTTWRWFTSGAAKTARGGDLSRAARAGAVAGWATTIRTPGLRSAEPRRVPARTLAERRSAAVAHRGAPDRPQDRRAAASGRRPRFAGPGRAGNRVGRPRQR